MARDTIALISTYIHPSGDSVGRMLRGAFPEFRFETFSILNIVKEQRRWLDPNLWHMLREYGTGITRGLIPARTRYFQTTYLFERIRDELRRRIDPARHVFSFQMQSQYDTSSGAVPHFIYTDHTHLSNLASPYFDRRLLRPKRWIALERTIYQNATRIFTRSSDVSADLVNLYDVEPQKVSCVYTGSNVHVSPEVAPTRPPYGARRILFVGGDWERKGGPVLVEAFRRVREELPDAQLTVIGCNPIVDVPGCTVLGQVWLDDVSAHYGSASVFCLPTRLEPFGIAFVEAMMHRLPIVATRTGAVPDMVEEGVNGRLVETGDSEGLAQALLEVLRDEAIARAYGEASHRRAVERYTWERVGQRMREAILPTLVSENT